MDSGKEHRTRRITVPYPKVLTRKVLSVHLRNSRQSPGTEPSVYYSEDNISVSPQWQCIILLVHPAFYDTTDRNLLWYTVSPNYTFV